MSQFLILSNQHTKSQIYSVDIGINKKEGNPDTGEAEPRECLPVLLGDWDKFYWNLNLNCSTTVYFPEAQYFQLSS